MKLQRRNGLSRDKARHPGLVIFDVEGVLVPKKRFLYFAVGRTLRLSQFLGIVFYGFLYEVGLISLKTALSHVFKVFKGMQVRELMACYEQIPIVSNAKEVLGELRRDGWKTALISSGLPEVVVKSLGSSLKTDYCFGIELEIHDNLMTGKISGDVIEDKGKLQVLRSILAREELLPEDCVVVADDRNNASIFLPQAFKIGYNPDFLISVKADVVLSGKLPEILPVIRGESKPASRTPTRNAMIRETIHASGFFVPLIAAVFGLSPTLFIISAIALLYAISETLRMERTSVPVVSSVTRASATQPELYEFATAPLFFALGILLTLLAFPLPVSSVAVAAFCLGDSTASLFGGSFGKRMLPFNKRKTLEGSVACFVFAFCGAMFFTTPVIALLAAVAATTVECLPWPLNDNFVTPLLTGLVLLLTQQLL